MISREEHARLRASIDAFERARQQYDPKRYARGGGYDPKEYTEIARMAGLTREPSNTDKGKVEVYEFVHDPPEKYFAYYDKDLTKITSFMGDKLGDITWKGTPFSGGFGGKRVNIQVKAINGFMYSGTCNLTGGTYCRLKMLKGQKNPLTRAETIEIEHEARRARISGEQIQSPGSRGYHIGRSEGMREVMKKYGTYARTNPGKEQAILAENFVKGANSGVASSMYIHGNTVYSYGPHFPIARREGDLILITTKKAPSKTTAGHIGLIKRAAQEAGKEVGYQELAPEAAGPAAYSNPMVDLYDGKKKKDALLVGVMPSYGKHLLVDAYKGKRRLRTMRPSSITIADEYLKNPRGVHESQMDRAAREVGLYVATWAPGDGQTRYRFFTKPSSYDEGDGIYTALGRGDAMRFIAAYRIGRQSRGNPASLGRYARERIADPARFDARSFRTVPGKGGHKVVVGCPKSHFHSGRCTVGTRAQSILHPASETARLVRSGRKITVGRGPTEVRVGRRVAANGCCNNPRHRHVVPNPLLQTVLLANPGNPDLTRFDDRNLRSIFAWLTKFGMGRRFPGMPIGWYQQHQFAAIDVIAALAKARGIEDLTKVRVAQGSVQIRDPKTGKWVTLDTVYNIFKKADDKTRGISNPPIAQVWDTLTHRRRHAALEFAGFPDDYAWILAKNSWTSLSTDAKRALQRQWAANPLTRKESGRILKEARRDVRYAGAFVPGHTRSEKSGQGFARADVVNRFGPRSARRASARVMRRAQDTVGTTMSSSGMPRARMNPSVRIPFRDGQQVPIARARAWVEQYGTPELKKAFRDAERLQTKANRRPRFVTWKTLPIGDSRQIEMVTALSHYGDTPDTYYKAPKGSRKGRHLYRHKWGEGGGKKSVPLLASSSGKALIMPLGGRKVASDWLRH